MAVAVRKRQPTPVTRTTKKNVAIATKKQSNVIKLQPKRKKKVVRVHRPERDREIHKVLQLIMKSGKSPNQICKGIPVSPSTVRRWYTKTKYPQFYTLRTVAEALGAKYVLISADIDVKEIDAS